MSMFVLLVLIAVLTGGVAAEIVERRQNAVRSRVDADRGNVAPADGAPAVDHEQRPLRDALVRAVDSVPAGNRALGLEVGQQWKSQLAVFSECEVAPDPV